MNNLLYLLIITFMIFPLACKESENKSEKNHSNPTDVKIKYYKSKIDREPTNYSNYDNLAQSYIQKARETGETSYYSQAQKTVGKSLEINPNNYVGTVLLAKTEIAKHKFKNALEHAKRAVELKPERSVAYGILGDAFLELKETGKAEESYEKMLDINPNMDSYSRIANLKFEQGKYAEAVEYMKLAYDSGAENSSVPKENLAWAQFMIGSYYLETGNLNKAEIHFKRSLDIFDNYYLTVEHLAELDYLRNSAVLKLKQKIPHKS